MANKMTTRDLIGSLIDLELDKQMLELQSNPDENSNEPEIQSELVKVNAAIETIKIDIARKTSGIDHMIVEMNKNTNLIDAEIRTHMDEVKRLRNRKNAIKRTEDYFNKELLPMIIETAGNDGVFQTETTRYKMFETWGPLEITDEEAIPDNFKRYKVEIDKKKARKEVIAGAEDGLGISGFKIEKVKRVRRS